MFESVHMTFPKDFIINSNFLAYMIWFFCVCPSNFQIYDASRCLWPWIQKVQSHNPLQIQPSIMTIWNSQRGIENVRTSNGPGKDAQWLPRSGSPGLYILYVPEEIVVLKLFFPKRFAIWPFAAATK